MRKLENISVFLSILVTFHSYSCVILFINIAIKIYCKSVEKDIYGISFGNSETPYITGGL